MKYVLALSASMALASLVMALMALGDRSGPADPADTGTPAGTPSPGGQEWEEAVGRIEALAEQLQTLEEMVGTLKTAPTGDGRAQTGGLRDGVQLREERARLK